jgi:hypothetical protein
MQLVSIFGRTNPNRKAVFISAAARNNVPAVHPNLTQARDGGLLSYGPDQV